MARQLDVAARSLRRAVLLRQGWPWHVHTRRLFSSVSSSDSSRSDVSTRSGSSNIDHQSFVTSVPNLQALEHVRWLLQQPQRRVLLLTGSSASDSATRSVLEQDAPAFELERLGHGVFGVREFCQLLLRESGRERRVFGRAQLAALLLHDGLERPGASQLAATSTLQRRKGAQDLLQLFRLLEREGVTPEQYRVVTDAGGEQVPRDLADKYAAYQQLLVQHNATSWDGLVMDVLTLCGVQPAADAAQDATGKQFSDSVLREYTDVVLDDVQRMTPAMARLVGHLCGQPSVQSSASFSRVLLEDVECARTQILERQLMETAVNTGQTRDVTRLGFIERGENVEKRAKMLAFARQILTQSAGSSDVILSPVPLKCWRFGVSEAEERSVGAYLADCLKRDEATRATVLCPSYADVHRVTVEFKKQGLPVHMDGNRFSAASSSSAPIHLFDEPGVNTVYSLLCALCYPSDSRYLYNVLRSDFFGFPAELLSWIMEKEHRSHAGLLSVIEAFVENRGQSLGTSLQQKENERQELPQTVSSQLENGLETAASFVKIIKRLQAECHSLSATEMVQIFLEETGRLESLRSPNSPEEERASLVLADFLQELETAQNIVGSAQVTFVAPYLLQLRETNLTSAAARDEVLPEATGTGRKTTTDEAGIRVLPLTAYSLESLAASVNDKEKDSKHVLVLMSMRDSKFPGRMKRLTLPLPYDLLSEPFPVQTRTEHLGECQQLAYGALTLGVYDEVVLSFAELAATSASKREILSRTFQPIWHEGDQPAAASIESKTRGGTSNVSPSPEIAPSRKPLTSPAAQHETTPESAKASPYWLLEIMRSFVSRIFLPLLHHEKRSLSADASPARKSGGDIRAGLDQQGEATTLINQPKAAKVSSSRSPMKKISYDPPHLSYSQISEYLGCPHRYYLSRVIKLDGDVSTSMMFGRALHEGVAAFAKSLATAQQNSGLTKEAKTLAAVEGEETFMRAWTGDGYGLFSSEEQASFLLECGMMALWDFIETHHGDLHLQEILHVEQEFSFYVPQANVELRGVWDRIDRVSRLGGDGSSVVIKEFKSNMGDAERNMRKLAEDSLQLKMYMYAFRQVFGEAPYGAKLQLIGGNYNEPSSGPTKTRRKRISKAGNDDNGFVHFSEQAAQEAEDTIVEVVSGLRNGDFEPKPSFAGCAFCPFAGSACHFASDDASYERQSARQASARSS